MQTTATYTKIQRTPKMERAIKRAKHVRVEIVDFEARQFRVHSTTRPGVTYLVDLTIAPNGDRLGQCECIGFRYSGECTHRAAAVGFYRGVLRSRQEAEKLAATAQGGGVASEPERGWVIPAPAHKPVDEVNTQRATVCSVCGRETGGGRPSLCCFIPAVPDYPIENESHNVETFCSVCGRETGGGRCDVDLNAEILTRREVDELDRENSVLIKRPLTADVRLHGFSI
jgi:hypothetical protein